MKIIMVFPYNSGNNFVGLKRDLQADKTNVRTKEHKGLFNSYNPKIQLFAKLKQKSWNLFSKIERIKTAVQAKKSVR